MSSSTRGFVPFGPRVQRRTVIRRFDVRWRLGGGGEGEGSHDQDATLEAPGADGPLESKRTVELD